MVKSRWVVALLLMTQLASCSYWRARPQGDTAPSAWGSSSVGNATTSAAAGPPGAQSTATMEETLHNLEKLHRDGLISDAEYRERRMKVIAGAFE